MALIFIDETWCKYKKKNTEYTLNKFYEYKI